MAAEKSPIPFASLLQSIPGVVYRRHNDAAGTFEFLSVGMLGLTGHAAGEFLAGRQSYGEFVYAEDRERVCAAIRNALASRASFSVEYRIIARDGTQKWVREHGSGVFAPYGAAPMLEGFIEDISERKGNEEALRESEARFRSLTELSSDWFWEQDAELRYVSTTGRSTQRSGISAEEHPGRRRWELPATEILGQTWDEHRAGLEARKPFRDLMLRRTAQDGTKHYMSVAGAPFYDPNGAFRGYRGVARDVTESVLAERQARAADERVQLAIEHLGESIAIVDAEDRLVVSNRQFRALNGNTRLVEPGHLYEDHQRAGMALGNYPEAVGREEEWLAKRLALRRAGGTMELKRQDGRWMQVTDQRLPDGGMISFGLDITAHKEAELTLAKSERRFRDFAEAGLDWFWETDAQGRYIWFSDSVERVGGAKPQWHYGKKRTDLAAKTQNLEVEPWKSHLRVLERHEPFRDFRYERAGPNGTNWLSVSGLPYFDADGDFAGYRGSGTDVTQRVLAEQQASTARELLLSALENLGEMICLTDAEDRILISNRQFVEFNAAVAEFTTPGRKYDEHLRAGIALGLFPDAIGREEPWLAERLALRRTSQGPRERRRQDGRWLLVGDQLLPDGSIITFGLEITERKRAEEALRNINTELELRVGERTTQLEATNRELEATNRELESFSYAVSHDLRAPLRAVTGFSNILLKDTASTLSEDGRRYLGIIDNNARRMGNLIDALLSLGKISRLALNKAPVDMTRIASEACEELRAAWPGARINLSPLPMGQGNEILLKQVFVNLVGNALKYSANKPDPRVQLRAEAGRYIVSDNGVGFEMAYADKLFKPFERLHSEREFAGTGIGLAIVKLILERHGGVIEARGTPGEGALFSFTLGE